MPEAEPFTFIGSIGTGGVLFTGFPFRFVSYDIKPELDAGTLDKWTTFSGHTLTTAPTEASIAASLDAAAKLYWNLSGVDFDGSSVYPSGSTFADGINALNEPKGRVCDVVNEFEEYGSGFSRIQAGYHLNKFTIQKLYYGDVFLGYGSEVKVGFLFVIDGLFWATSTIISPTVIINLLGGSGTTTGYSTRDVANAVVDIDGIYFVCQTSCQSTSTNIDLDPANLHASADSSGAGTATVSFDINALNFYTYPT
jgi:hypothetical protein